MVDAEGEVASSPDEAAHDQPISTPDEARLEELEFVYEALALPERSEEAAAAMQQRFLDYWCTPPEEGIPLHAWALDRLGIRDPEDQRRLTFEELRTVAGYRTEECQHVLFMMKRTGMYCTGAEGRKHIARSFAACKKAYELVRLHLLSPYIFDGNRFSSTPLPQDVTDWQANFVHRNLAEFVPSQQVIVTLLDRLMHEGYRRLGGECYKEIMGQGGYGTHAWEPVCDIDEYVYRAISKDINAKVWETATANASIIPETIKYLTNCYDIEFPALEPDRSLFSFSNGQFDVKCGSFHASDPSQGSSLRSDRVSVRYFDVPFDPDLAIKPWEDIRTPLFDSIFEHQGFDRETLRVVYVMLGRLLFPVNEHDQWQVAPFFKGVAGCGKSTVAAIVSHWYPPKFVSTISCNMEERFGLANVIDTFMTWCTEVTAKFPLPRGVWQSMVTGEPVVVPRKNKSAVQGAWKVPIAMAGNELFGYEDKSCSVHRRTVIFPMRKSVDKEKADPMLLEKLKADPAPLLVKCSRAYLDYAKRRGEESFWSGVATTQMTQWHKELLVEIDTISAFFSSNAIVLGAEDIEYVLEKDLKDTYKRWIQDQGYRYNPKDWSSDHMATVYDRFQCVCSKRTKRYPKNSAKVVDGLFVLGVSLATDAEEPQGGAGGSSNIEVVSEGIDCSSL